MKNMKNKTLGQVIKEQRETLGLTQRQLAAKLDVKPSHVAYLENGQRRPSLSLVARLADVLGLEKEQLFLLAHPEAISLIGAHREAPHPKTKDEAWKTFAADKALLARHNITAQELKVLSHVNMLGRVTAPRHFLFILNAIRQSVDE